MPLAYKMPSYQSIFDALVTVQVPLDNIVSILRESDLDLDSELTGESIIYEESNVSVYKGGQIPTFATPEIAEYVTNSTQNIFDICLMTVGDLNKLVSLVSSNTIFNSINSSPGGVKAVIYNTSDITDSGLKLAFKKSNINITTGDIEADQEGFLLQEDESYILQEDSDKIIL